MKLCILSSGRTSYQCVYFINLKLWKKSLIANPTVNEDSLTYIVVLDFGEKLYKDLAAGNTTFNSDVYMCLMITLNILLKIFKIK